MTDPAARCALTFVVLADDAAAAETTLRSLLEQTADDFEVLICLPLDSAGGSVEPDRFPGLAIRVVDAPGFDWTERLEACLAEATGRHVVLLEGGDTVDPAYVLAITGAIDHDGWLYTDEATPYANGIGHRTWLKPDFSPELLRSCPYAVRTAVLPLDVLRTIGGADLRAGRAAWYDLVLRFVESGRLPQHIAGPYYFRAPEPSPDDPPWVADLGPLRRDVVLSHCRRTSLNVAEVSDVCVNGRAIGQRLHRALGGHPRVSVVIPTAGTSTWTHGVERVHIVELVRDLVTAADPYPDLELVVVYDSASTPQPVLDEITAAAGAKAVLVSFGDEFSFSRKCNLGALAASGELLLFLNDDVSILGEEWLTEMVALIEDPGVGMVGARLLFADGTLQHAGHRYDGLPTHTALGEGADSLAEGGLAQLTSERSGVTAACALIRKADFLEVGGFSNHLPLNYNDVDLCLKVRSTGARILYTPHAVLEHYESQSRESVRTEYEADTIRRRWAFHLDHDPYVNMLERHSGVG